MQGTYPVRDKKNRAGNLASIMWRLSKSYDLGGGGTLYLRKTEEGIEKRWERNTRGVLTAIQLE